MSSGTASALALVAALGSPAPLLAVVKPAPLVGSAPLVAALGPAPAAGTRPAPDLLGGGTLVAYTPLGYLPDAAWRPRAAALRADAEDLARLGARAIVTPRATRALAPVCRFFKRRGFVTVVVGVADPTDAAELRAARALRRCADGYAVGSGGLAARRYPRPALEAAVAWLRRTTGRPVAVRELLASYRTDPRLLWVGDWVFPIADGDPTGGAQEACGITATAYRELLERGPQDRPLALAATGLPTAGAPAANEHAQRAYFMCLASRRVPFAHDEAYDQPWRGGVAARRGLFRDDGTPKLFAWQLARPRLTIEQTAPVLAGRVASATPARFRVLAYARGEHWQPQPAQALSRGGHWVVPGVAGRPVVVLLAAPEFAPVEPTDRPPPVDGVRLFARAEAPAPP